MEHDRCPKCGSIRCAGSKRCGNCNLVFITDDFRGSMILLWQQICRYLKGELSGRGRMVFGICMVAISSFVLAVAFGKVKVPEIPKRLSPYSDSYVTVEAVPEPGTYVALGIGLAAIVLVKRR